MAFNDMNSWDEDPDELLRRHWQQVFAEYKVQPRPSLSRRIIARLSAKQRRKSTRWLTVTGLLLLVSAGLIYQVRVAKRASSSHVPRLTSKSTLPTRLLSASSNHPSKGRAGQRLPLNQAVLPSLSNRSVAEGHLNRHLLSKGEISRPEASSRRRTPTQPLSIGQPEHHLRAGVITLTTRLKINPFRLKRGSSLATRFPTVQTNLTHTVGSESIVAPANWIGEDDPRSFSTSQSLISPSSINALPVSWTRLNFQSMLRLPSQLKALPHQLPVITRGSGPPVRVSVVQPRWRWFVDVVPLSSFQWMSVSPASSAYLSNVHAPAAFSPDTWGYQLNGGLRMGHWLAYVAMGQLRRWAYYTVNENRYWIEPTAADPHQLVRDVHTITENISLPMIGAGLSQQRLLAEGRYAVEVGGQVSYLPTSHQPFIGLRGGASRRLLLNGRTELQIGLTAEYGLNRLLSDQQQLRIHPLVLGFGLRLQPRYHPE